MEMLSVTDLFAVGLALDLVGAYLLSRGLLASYPTLALRAGTYWDGNPHVAADLAEDRVDGRFGVAYLVLGFTLQAVGYVLDLALSPSTEGSLGRAGVALGLALSTGAGALLLWRRKRREHLKRTLLEMAYWDTSVSPPIRGDLLYAGLALKWAASAGFSPDEFGVRGGLSRPPRPREH